MTLLLMVLAPSIAAEIEYLTFAAQPMASEASAIESSAAASA